ncbi:MAG: hypothetical protein E3K32_08815 [wastewater metagenome]|nr:hypothetical protein [Candidatus Loosdrechtia aerotolerans]
MEHRIGVSGITLSLLATIILFCLTGCFTTDTYHNKKHISTIKKDLDAAHKDIDTLLGINEPSPLVEDP